MVAMHVDPQFLLGVVPDALVLLVEPVESPTYDIVLCFDRSAVKFDPRALLDQFEDVSSRADSVRETGRCISG